MNLLMVLLCKVTCAPIASHFKGQREHCFLHAPPFRHPSKVRPWLQPMTIKIGQECGCRYLAAAW